MRGPGLGCGVLQHALAQPVERRLRHAGAALGRQEVAAVLAAGQQPHHVSPRIADSRRPMAPRRVEFDHVADLVGPNLPPDHRRDGHGTPGRRTFRQWALAAALAACATVRRIGTAQLDENDVRDVQPTNPATDLAGWPGAGKDQVASLRLHDVIDGFGRGLADLGEQTASRTTGRGCDGRAMNPCTGPSEIAKGGQSQRTLRELGHGGQVLDQGLDGRRLPA